MTQPILADTSLLPMPAGASIGPVNIVQAMLRVLTHHWWKILAIWAVVTAGLVYAINVRVKPTYETYSLLRVDPPERDLFGLGRTSGEDFQQFLLTQVELIKSPSILIATLNKPNVAATSLVRESRDPESELRARLQVNVVQGTSLIRIGMTSPQSAEGALIINEVVRDFLVVANRWTYDKNKFHVAKLKEYNDELSRRTATQQKNWLELAAKSNTELVDSPSTSANGSALPHAMPNRISIDQYRRIQEQLFTTSMQLIETEALHKNRQAEIEARSAGVDPEQLVQRRVKDTLRKDPEVVSLVKEIDLAQRKVDQADYRARSQSDPSLRHAKRQLDDLKQQLTEVCETKKEELAMQFRGQIEAGASPKELSDQIESMKIRKRTYEQHLSQIEVDNRQQGTDAVKVALIIEDLHGLKQMQDSVFKQIEQLEFDSRREARIVQIDPARQSGMPIKDSRWKLRIMTPVGVIAVVLGLFLFLEIRSGRVSDLDEVSRRVPVEIYPVPSLPGTRRTSNQRTLRANEVQLQEFLQSLDHLRVSLWFGKEAIAGSGRCLMVTSAIGGEGKTTLAAHLAVCCAKAGISTLVIDADLRRAALSRMFEEEQTPGLSDVLKGDLSPDGAVIALRDGGFHLLPAGSPGQHPGWLFREQRIGQALSQYRQMFDLVIIDTPPVLPVVDALSLGRWVDGAIMVIRYDVSRFPMVERARRRLISAGIPILKTVVNAVKASPFASAYNYGYGGSYAYGSRTAAADTQRASPDENHTGSMVAGSQEAASF